jgi:hypothetical protein
LGREKSPSKRILIDDGAINLPRENQPNNPGAATRGIVLKITLTNDAPAIMSLWQWRTNDDFIDRRAVTTPLNATIGSFETRRMTLRMFCYQATTKAQSSTSAEVA